jgi:hypothetical protein
MNFPFFKCFMISCPRLILRNAITDGKAEWCSSGLGFGDMKRWRGLRTSYVAYGFGHRLRIQVGNKNFQFIAVGSGKCYNFSFFHHCFQRIFEQVEKQMLKAGFIADEIVGRRRLTIVEDELDSIILGVGQIEHNRILNDWGNIY